MKIMNFFISIVLYLSCHIHSYAESISIDTLPSATAPWKTWKENTYQRVQYRPVIIQHQELLEISTKTSVNSSLSGFLLFLKDVSNTPNWLVNASESKNIKIYSPTVNSFYIKMGNLWPLKPRILLLHSSYWQNDDLSIEINVRDINTTTEVLPKLLINETDLTDYLQIKTYSAHWKITPVNLTSTIDRHKNEILIEYTYIADGKGSTPKWLADHFALKSIWKSMRNLRNKLPQAKWQQTKVQGITELSQKAMLTPQS